MKSDYIDKETRAIVSVDPEIRNLTWITRVNTPARHRNRGLASRLLTQVCNDADLEGVTLMLGIVPTGPLNHIRLQRFYSKFNFVMINYDFLIMRRIPIIGRDPQR